jgi:hypothetical protein
MKYLIFFSFVFVFLSGCGLRQREQELERKMNQVTQKEQELLLKEQSLQLKEEELAKREKLLQDTKNKNPADSFIVLNPQIPGKWNVTMQCLEATCTGSAVGDTKNEQWEFSYQENAVLVQAFSDDKLVRVYSGTSTNNTLELLAKPGTDETAQPTKIIVRITGIEESKMQGTREIIRPEDCRVVYALDLVKQ